MSDRYISKSLFLHLVEDIGKFFAKKQDVPKKIKTGTVISENADFAEVGEWSDGNPNDENRIGYFVSVDGTEAGKTMVKATSMSDVRGITMSHPAFAANASADKYDADGNLLKQYDYVGFAGFVPVIDNGTCTVNGRCMPSDDGTAVPSSNNLGYRVIERIDDMRVIVLVEPQSDMIVRIKDDIIQLFDDISNLSGASDEKIVEAVDNYMANNPIEESDPTVPEWAKSPQKPTYTASEVGADAAGTAESKVSEHNVSDAAHNDIRLLVQGLAERLNTLADSDDTTLDQMSEVVAYIKSNKSLIDAITTSKINVSDIIDNLSTNVSNKPLSAAQGVALKALIDAITSVELDESLSDNTKAAPAGMVGELKGDIEQLKQSGGTSEEEIRHAVEDYLTENPIEESDPTVSDWAKQPTKPKYTASEVGALPAGTKIPSKTSDLQNDSGFLTEHQDLSGYATKGEIPKTASDVGADASGTAESKVSAHNTATDAHNDIRLLVQGLAERLNTLADSDDETLDRMSEIVSYIKYNRSLINGIDTNKVDISDIINNLTSNNTNKPLSAKQGRVLKSLIDGIVIPEKLPNPYPLTFTGGASGSYDGSEALTINIPLGGDGSTYYVTPEQFGAVGDGTTDDTEAFRQAIETEYPIICMPGKNYYFANEIVTSKTRVNIDGNYSHLTAFALKINVNDDETSWNSGESYPQPESTIKNVLFDNIEMDYCIKTGIPLKLQNIKFNNYGSCLKNYGPYMDYMVLDNIHIVHHTGTEYAIDLAYLGDQHVFKEVHCSGDFSTDNFTNKFIRISGCNSAKFENCILNGFVDIYDSTVIFDSCHMENPGGIGLGENADSSNIKFLGCFFWDMFKMPNGKYVEYDSCNIYLTHQAYGNGTNDYLALNTHNTSIDIGDTQSFGRMSLDAYTRKEYESEYSESLCILDDSPLAESGSKNWPLETGTYKYTFFPSNNPLSIENSDYSKSKKELNVTVNSDTSQVRFYVNESYDFIWCYRTSPSGVIKRAICTCETKLWDFGESINGILWTNVNKIPEPMKSIVNIKNDIYYSENGNVNANNVLVVNKSAKSITYKVGESVNYVNYILSDGSQWIDTGIIPDGNTEIEYKFQDDTRTDGWENIFGSSGNSYCVNRYNNWSQTFVLRVNNTETLFEVSEEKQQNGCTIKISNAEKTIYLNNISVGTFSASVNATDSIVLFARRRKASGSDMINSNGIFKLYYFTIKQNSETVRDFRPAIDEDGIVCLYDNITNKYYYNAGTGSFDYR